MLAAAKNRPITHVNHPIYILGGAYLKEKRRGRMGG
jgi:hypothetical protein